jgi:hypothetical protein
VIAGRDLQRRYDLRSSDRTPCVDVVRAWKRRVPGKQTGRTSFALKEAPGLEAAKPREDEVERSVTHAHKIP